MCCVSKSVKSTNHGRAYCVVCDAVVKTASSQVTLSVLSSSCTDVENAIDLQALTDNLVAAAAANGVTITAAQVSVVIAGCSASRRQEDATAFIDIARHLQTSVSLSIDASVSDLDSSAASTVR